jgi:hypothetical protein
VTRPVGLPLFHAGEAVSAAALNALREAVDRAAPAAGHRIVESPGGWAQASPDDGAFYARVLSSTSSVVGAATVWAHAFEEVVEVPGTPLSWEVKQEGAEGTTTVTPLYDVNGGRVADGVVVRARPGLGEYFVCRRGLGAGGGGDPGDCDVTTTELDCQGGVLIRRTRTVRTVQGCLEAGDWSDWEQIGYCDGDDPDPTPGPPCLALSYRYDCEVDPTDSESRLAEYVSRTLMKDGCIQQTAWERVRFLPICCDCPSSGSGSGPDVCDEEDGVDTDCCSGVPCDLCLYIYFDHPSGCGEVQVDLPYDAAGYDDGTGTLLPAWRASGAAVGSCSADAELVCFPATATVPAFFSLLLTFDGTTQVAAALRTADCSPLLLIGGFKLLTGNPCCPGDTAVDVVIRPGPCPDGGSGSGAEAGCCDDPAPPATLYVTFDGALGSRGTVELTQNMAGDWVATGTDACGNYSLTFFCEIGEGYSLADGGSGTPFAIGATSPDSCDPFLWQGSGIALSGTCPGAFTAVVTE